MEIFMSRKSGKHVSSIQIILIKDGTYHQHKYLSPLFAFCSFSGKQIFTDCFCIKFSNIMSTATIFARYVYICIETMKIYCKILLEGCFLSIWFFSGKLEKFILCNMFRFQLHTVDYPFEKLSENYLKICRNFESS